MSENRPKVLLKSPGCAMPSRRRRHAALPAAPSPNYSPIDMLLAKLKALLRPTRLAGRLVFLYEAGFCPPAQRLLALVSRSLRFLPDKVITASACALPRMSISMFIDAAGRVDLKWPGPAG